MLRRLLLRKRPKSGRGFTLVQLLVVIGIVALLASLALPTLMKARNSAKRSAMFFQLQSISVGLEAYKQDFGSYPQIDLSFGGLNQIPDSGGFTLARTLIAPADGSATAGCLADGQAGPGFRMTTGGKVYGPYLTPDTFRFGYAIPSGSGHSTLSPTDTLFTPQDYGRLVIADQMGKPIIYCPRLQQKPRFSQPNVWFVGRRPATVPGTGTPVSSLITDIFYYDLNGILGDPAPANNGAIIEAYRGLIRQPNETDDTLVVTRLQKLLGDNNNNGRLDSNEKATIDAPFLLWSAGLDGQFGPVADKASDDILFTNFGE